MATRCRKMTTKDLVARTEHEVGRKLTTAERAGLDLMPPQYDCATPRAQSSGGSGRARGRSQLQRPPRARRR
jgi:hypothetical protein